ncbi:hypothetical protein G3T14_19320 [Methylobacterium sp. BTF04]|uniref:hypothetical protein n=1 Tax=Methylobacterium sp. BTF04 TaxID=2708300 RepID=UPI0013D76E6F|nr:hypothetical protein [Methylobacterium sp. BTF04]NEU14260.1 hypothetical protein [Methylobacterium sp. BTF04]
MTTSLRVALTALVVGADYFLLRGGPGDRLGAAEAGRIAARQFQDADWPAAETAWAATALNGGGTLAAAGSLMAIAAIWLIGRRSAGYIAVAIAAVLVEAQPERAQAYYDTRDFPEFVEVLPNQTAFLIPEVGETKSGQAAFMSEQFLNEKKVAMKRVQIPHTLIRNPGWTYDYFVPAARLMLVDRSPVSREWVSAGERGTSAKDQGIRFETAESVTLRTGVVISAFVKEEDASKFVYWFGARTSTGNASDPQVNFASVILGKSLAEVVDENVHRTVQAAMAKEFGRRTTDEAIHGKAAVIEAVEKEVRRVYEPMGITITTLGYAEGLTFDNPEIQKSIDMTFMAMKNAQSAQAQMQTLPIQEKILDLKIREMDAQSRQTLAGRWNGSAAGVLPALPNWVVIPAGWMDSVKAWLQPRAPDPASEASH